MNRRTLLKTFSFLIPSYFLTSKLSANTTTKYNFPYIGIVKNVIIEVDHLYNSIERGILTEIPSSVALKIRVEAENGVLTYNVPMILWSVVEKIIKEPFKFVEAITFNKKTNSFDTIIDYDRYTIYLLSCEIRMPI